jgi:hypothetical protein
MRLEGTIEGDERESSVGAVLGVPSKMTKVVP